MERPEGSDVDELHVLLSAYSPVFASAVDAVARDIGVVSASQIKNTGTILEKLRRQGGHTLSSIQDLAGLRVVIDAGRAEQDRVVERLMTTFSGASRASTSSTDERSRCRATARCMSSCIPITFRSRYRCGRERCRGARCAVRRRNGIRGSAEHRNRCHLCGIRGRLMKSHGRYFLTSEQLGRRLAAA